MRRHGVLALLSISALSLPAFSEGLKAVQTVERAVLVADANGETSTVFEAADEIAPGDEVRYRLSYANEGADPASNVELVMPVPGEVVLIEGSAETNLAIVSYSVDNGATFADRDQLTVSENGEAKPASAADITHIRWAFSGPIAPGAADDLSFRGVLQ